MNPFVAGTSAAMDIVGESVWSGPEGLSFVQARAARERIPKPNILLIFFI
jgi:hypothetical protein